MTSILWKPFVHPQNVYKLEYPSHWDQVTKEEGRNCGFGPHDRDNVGLWISILPMSVDTDRLIEDLPKLFGNVSKEWNAGEFKRDPTLQHYGVKADITKEGEGGHYWIMAAGDLVLFASSQVPAAEREQWNPDLAKLMASLVVMREDALLYRQTANEVLAELRKRHPDQEFEFADKGIRGKNQVVYLGNVYRDVCAHPERRTRIVKEFVEKLSLSAQANLGAEVWEEVKTDVLPLLKPRDYIDPEGPTKPLHISEWLCDVVICYVIKSKKFYRFITDWDLNRWGITAETMQQQAMRNLSLLPWPGRMEGSRGRDGGRVVIIDTPDSMASTRILHPDLHRLFSGPLGSPFYVGIPERNTLVAYSNRRSLTKRIARQLKKDHDKSSYPITPRPFLVTMDGIAPAPEA